MARLKKKRQTAMLNGHGLLAPVWAQSGAPCGTIRNPNPSTWSQLTTESLLRIFERARRVMHTACEGIFEGPALIEDEPGLSNTEYYRVLNCILAFMRHIAYNPDLAAEFENGTHLPSDVSSDVQSHVIRKSCDRRRVKMWPRSCARQPFLSLRSCVVSTMYGRDSHSRETKSGGLFKGMDFLE